MHGDKPDRAPLCVPHADKSFRSQTSLNLKFEEDIKHFVLVKAEVGHLVSLVLKEVIWEFIDFGSDY